MTANIHFEIIYSKKEFLQSIYDTFLTDYWKIKQLYSMFPELVRSSVRKKVRRYHRLHLLEKLGRGEYRISEIGIRLYVDS